MPNTSVPILLNISIKTLRHAHKNIHENYKVLAVRTLRYRFITTQVQVYLLTLMDRVTLVTLPHAQLTISFCTHIVHQ